MNVGIGTDDTLFAKADGVVRFSHLGKDRKQVSIEVQLVFTGVPVPMGTGTLSALTAAKHSGKMDEMGETSFILEL